MHSAITYSADGIPDIIQFKDANSDSSFQVPFTQLTTYSKYKEMKETYTPSSDGMKDAPSSDGMKEMLAARKPRTPLRISLQKGCRFCLRILSEPINDQKVFNNLRLFFFPARYIAPQNLLKQPYNASDIPDFDLAIDYLGGDFDHHHLVEKQMNKAVDSYLPLLRKNESLFSWSIRQFTRNPPP